MTRNNFSLANILWMSRGEINELTIQKAVVSVGDIRAGLEGAGTRTPRQHQPRAGKAPKITLDPAHIPWAPVARAFLTKASASAMRKHQAKEITEAGEAKIGKGGEEDGDGRNR